MDLTKLDRPGLARLSDRLQSIATAADVMAEGGMEPEISLTAEATVLRAAPILSHGAEPPEPVLVEHLPDLPVVIDDAPQVPLGGAAIMDAPETKITDLPPSSPRPSPAAGSGGAKSASPARPARSKKGDRADTVKTGALTEGEREEILRRHAEGEENREIARAMNRRVQSIGLFLAAQNQKGKPKGGMRPIGEIAQAVVDEAGAQRETEDHPGQPAPAATAAEGQDPQPAAGRAVPAAEQPAPVAGGAGDGMLGGERGGLQRHSLAEHDPVQAVEAVEEVPPSTAEAPPGELHGLDRRIWQHLATLPMARGWDDELDLDMVDAFGRGGRADMIAADLGVDSRQMLDRYQAITAVIRDDRGHMTIDGQAAFIRVLRLWVKHRRQQAA